MSMDKPIDPHNHKKTRQRKLILEVMRDNRGRHLSADEIYSLVRAKDDKIGIATIYRTIKVLEEDGVLLKVRFHDGNTAKFELSTCNDDHTHHHLICVKCGSVQDVEEDLLGAIETIILKTKEFTVTDHRLIFYGVCKDCMKKQDIE